MSTDPTAAEIEAGAAAITRLGIAIGPHMRQVIAAAVLRAALPDACGPSRELSLCNPKPPPATTGEDT